MSEEQRDPDVIDDGTGAIMVSPAVFATLQAAIKYQGMDWRRVRREMRKAWIAAKRANSDD